MRSGELFAGVGGLGMAVDAVFGSAPAWFAEVDAAPSKVLAHRYPGVPNYGDVTVVDWESTPPVDILAGGFPCTDVSLAGRRAGLKDGTRSGLWSEFANAIDVLRPDWVVVENVRGLLSADADSDVESCPWCLGDGQEEHALRALGAVLGDLADRGFDAEWTGIRASDVGAPHGRFRVFILAWPAENTRGGGSGGRAEGQEPSRGDDATLGPDQGRDRGRPHPDVKLMPTPTAMDSGGSGGSNEHNVTLTDAVVRTKLGTQPNGRLFGTPRVSSGHGAGNLSRRQAGTNIESQVLLLPTPGAYDGARGGSQSPDKRRAGNHSVTIQDAAEHLTRWGPYADAIARWEQVLGRPAPAPVRMDGKGGKARLNPELCEWMMGWPSGHVTDPAIGLTRAEQLKACGNGVVPAQSEAALRSLLSRPGVPAW